MTKSEWKILLGEYNPELLSCEKVVEGLPRELINPDYWGNPASHSLCDPTVGGLEE